MDIDRRKGMTISAWQIVIFITIFVASASHACDNALNPRTHGDWDYTNSPMQTYRQNCNPQHTICQFPVRPITPKESDLNQRKKSPADLGTPGRPLPLDKDTPAGPEIGKTDH